jgi:hypothetical protein
VLLSSQLGAADATWVWRSIDDGDTWTVVLDLANYPDSTVPNQDSRQLLSITGGVVCVFITDVFLGDPEGLTWQRIAKDTDNPTVKVSGQITRYQAVAYNTSKGHLYLGLTNAVGGGVDTRNLRLVWRMENPGSPGAAWEDATFDQIGDLGYPARCAVTGMVTVPR